MKLNIIKLTIKQLLIRNIHVGYIRKFLNRQIKPYLIGFQSGLNVFNLKYINLQLKLLLHLIVNVISLRQKILLVNHYKEMGNFLPLLKLKRCYFLDGPWVGGFLTNYKKIRFYTTYSSLEQPQLNSLTTMPSIVIFLNTTQDNWGLKESINLNIPSSVFTGSSFELLSKTYYPIVSNNHSLGALLFYCHIISNAVKKGLLKEQFFILNFKKAWVTT